jgi:hypothetical protein
LYFLYSNGVIMPNIRFDWRWIIAIVVIAVLANSRSIPWQAVAGIMALSGGYLLYLGWQVAGGIGGRRESQRVTYWRGQRIETQAPPRQIRTPSLRELAPASLYLILGVALLLGALAMVARVFRF